MTRRSKIVKDTMPDTQKTAMNKTTSLFLRNYITMWVLEIMLKKIQSMLNGSTVHAVRKKIKKHELWGT